MQPAQLEVDLGFFPLMWILYLVSPWLSINGHAQKQSWGIVRLTLPPGQYLIEAWYPYLFSSQQSKGSMSLMLAPGGFYRVKYRPAWLVFLAGSMTLVTQQLLAPGGGQYMPPGQYPPGQYPPPPGY
ncbi:MAG TPA: hypothetical protein VL326_07895 [Kofleriaceae bacterium]|nr:hypothetical protein [Kofleriaceae bacterium]